MGKRRMVTLGFRLGWVVIGGCALLLPVADAKAPLAQSATDDGPRVVDVSYSAQPGPARQGCNALGRRDERAAGDRARAAARVWVQHHTCDVSEADQHKLLMLFALWRGLS